jgi:hypothetical protein
MVLSRSRLVAPAVAVALALVAIVTHAQGVDVAAATYRIELFARSGLTLWDTQWYGGHWTLNYSVIFAPIGWLTGIPLMEIVCVAVAAWAFDRLAVARFGAVAGRLAALTFAAGMITAVAIGQEPYLLGMTIGLVALVAAHARRWVPAYALALASALASPLTGGFLALAAIAWMAGTWPANRWRLVALAAAGALPVGVLELLFPGQGMMPFATLNFLGMTAGCLALGTVVARRGDRTLAAGVALYAAALVFTYAVPSAIGANITRLGISFGVALCVALAVERHRGRALLAAAALPIALAQWVPAIGPLSGQFSPSMQAAYFQPLLRYLHGADRPLGRVEVVPTQFHWEAAYVAPSFPLARGWERQLDTQNNAIFYTPGALTASSYRHWLVANGVRFVALPDVGLDYAAKAEAVLVRRGMPGLVAVWHSAHWRVYRVAGSPGIVSGPARLVSESGAQVVLSATRPGSIVVRERFVPAWHVTTGHASVSAAHGGWLRVQVHAPGRVELRVGL